MGLGQGENYLLDILAKARHRRILPPLFYLHPPHGNGDCSGGCFMFKESIKRMRFDEYSDGVIWGCILALSATALVAQLALLDRRSRIQVEHADTSRYIAELHHDAWMGGVIDAIDWTHDPSEVPSGELPRLQPSITDLFVEAVIQIESAGKPDVIGKAGERGLMQIKRETWREVTTQLFGKPVSFSRAFEPELNRQVGQAYLRMLVAFLYQHQEEWQSDMRSLLLASYNAGPTHVREVGFDLRRLPASTQDYVDRAMALHDFFLTDAPEMTAWAAPSVRRDLL